MHIPVPEHPHGVLLPRQRGRTGAGAASSGTRALSTGAIVGIVIGSVVGVAAIALVIWTYCYRKRRARAGPRPRKQRKERSEDPLYASRV